ncbi:AMP-binding protein [Candidatus Woesearchaeota archaeon]|nr:AMP-binding protein [Candidatus Woesearchaeota archaeon]
METLVQLVSRFKQYDNDIAVIHKAEFREFRWTYSKLHSYIKRFAAFLEKSGIRKGDRIAVMGYNSPAYLIVFFGAILKGVILVPLDIRCTDDFIGRVMQQAKPRLLFSTRYRSAKIKAKRIILEDLDLLLEGINPSEKKESIKKEDIVEIVYTSGTTGNPKGVILTHKNITSNISSLKKVFRLSPKDRFLSLLPLSHLFEQTVGLFTPLSSGSSIVYISSLKPSAIFDALKEDITIMVLVPRILQSLKKRITSEAKKKGKEKALERSLKIAERVPFSGRIFFRKVHKLFPKVRFLIVGGSPLSISLERFWDSMGFRLIQGYGLTECSPVVSCNSPKKRRIGSVGKVIPDVHVKIGQYDEILVKGSNITQGYYKRDEETKKLFADNWMRTGDIGCLDDEGFLFIKGRKKDMIATPEGVNVYPEDIEDVVNSIKGVKESCVIGVKEEGQEEVHAVLLLEKGHENEAGKIIRQANKRLSQYQQIKDSTVWPMKDFPRTSTMKIKKNIVRDAVKKQVLGKKQGTEPEKGRVYSIIAGIKGVSEGSIRPRSNLVYDLKLSSIDRVELVSEIEQEFNIDIEEELITDKTTVRDLKKLIERKASEVQKQRRWALRWPIKTVRRITQELLIFPIMRIFCSIDVKGKENLSPLSPPVIFVSNHTSHFDSLVIMSKLPSYLKKDMAIAASKEYFEVKSVFKRIKKRAMLELGTALLNLYLFSQKKGFIKSIRYTGELISRGFNILIFPEGERTKDGKIRPFKQGIGLIASNMKVPIVPVRIEGLFRILPRGSNFPKKRGRVMLKFGKPIYPGQYLGFSKGLYSTYAPYSEITKKIEDSVKSL